MSLGMALVGCTGAWVCLVQITEFRKMTLPLFEMSTFFHSQFSRPGVVDIWDPLLNEVLELLLSNKAYNLVPSGLENLQQPWHEP